MTLLKAALVSGSWGLSLDSFKVDGFCVPYSKVVGIDLRVGRSWQQTLLVGKGIELARQIGF